MYLLTQANFFICHVGVFHNKIAKCLNVINKNIYYIALYVQAKTISCVIHINFNTHVDK